MNNFFLLTDEFADASETLEALASTETTSLQDKKTFLSLSKLTMQFSEAEPEVIEKTLQGFNQSQQSSFFTNFVFH